MTNQANEDELRREIARNLWMVFAEADWERTPKQYQVNGSLNVSEATEELLALILSDRKKYELQARIDENNRWRTILVPSDDYNTADMDDFNDRVVELKQELEKL